MESDEPRQCIDNNSDENCGNDMSEKEWKEKYRGDSRNWLIRDASGSTAMEQCSTMKDTYQYPKDESNRLIGDRRALLLQKLYDEAAADIIREGNKPPPVEKYCTEYEGNYHIPECCSEKKNRANKELYEKYPLYSSKAMSFWNFKLRGSHRSGVCLPGLTTSIDPSNPFKRNSAFTKPISEVLDGNNL